MEGHGKAGQPLFPYAIGNIPPVLNTVRWVPGLKSTGLWLILSIICLKGKLCHRERKNAPRVFLVWDLDGSDIPNEPIHMASSCS
jgi:hypothetical protein